MKKETKRKINKISTAGIITIIGLALLKYVPMNLWGKDILFDASMHLSLAIFVLYALWFFVDQDKNLRIYYFILSAVILIVISFQRIITNNHNDTGLLLGLILGFVAIIIAEWRFFKDKLSF